MSFSRDCIFKIAHIVRGKTWKHLGSGRDWPYGTSPSVCVCPGRAPEKRPSSRAGLLCTLSETVPSCSPSATCLRLLDNGRSPPLGTGDPVDLAAPICGPMNEKNSQTKHLWVTEEDIESSLLKKSAWIQCWSRLVYTGFRLVLV